jgi:outer membrane protein
MSRIPGLTMLACALLWPAVFIGCASQDAYRYDTIKAEYADMACNLGKSQAADTPPATCAVNSSLTLQDVLDIARDNNPDLLMALARIERARAMLEKSAAPFYPQVNVYTEYLQGDAPSAYLFKSIDQRKLPPDADFNDPGWFENYESGISAGINLFNGGRDGLNRKMAQAGLTISQLDRDGIENQVMATAIGAYYDVLAAANFTTVAQKRPQKPPAPSCASWMSGFQSGGALKTDLLSLQVSAWPRPKRFSSRAETGSVWPRQPWPRFSGLSPRCPLASPRQRPVPSMYRMTHFQHWTTPWTNRPELAGVREKLRRSKMAVDASRAGYLPQVDFMTRYYVDDPEMKYSTDRANWTAGLYLNWKIFDGFATRSDRAEALSHLQETHGGRPQDPAGREVRR